MVLKNTVYKACCGICGMAIEFEAKNEHEIRSLGMIHTHRESKNVICLNYDLTLSLQAETDER